MCCCLDVRPEVHAMHADVSRKKLEEGVHMRPCRSVPSLQEAASSLTTPRNLIEVSARLRSLHEEQLASLHSARTSAQRHESDR